MNINQHPFFKVLDKLNCDMFNQIMNSPINDITELYKDESGNILFNPLNILIEKRKDWSKIYGESIKENKKEIMDKTLFMIYQLLEKGLDPNLILEDKYKVEEYYTALQLSAKYKDAKVVNTILKFSIEGINWISKDGNTALGNTLNFYATTNGSSLTKPPLATENLLSHGALFSMDFKKRLYTLFDKKDGQKNNTEWLKLLLKYNFKIEEPLNNGLSLIHLLAKNKQLDGLTFIWKNNIYNDIGKPEGCRISIEEIVHPNFKQKFMQEFIGLQKETLSSIMEKEIKCSNKTSKKNRL